jgi:hypothetical protein
MTDTTRERVNEPDRRPDNSGLDDGPWLPGHQPRRMPPKKSPEELALIRAKAWATRRAKKVTE